MRKRLREALLPAMVVLCPAQVAPAADSWVEVRSPSFVVVSDASEKDARRVAWQFEKIRGLLGAEWRWARLDPGRPLLILAVRDEDGMRRLAPAFWEKAGSVKPHGLFVSTRAWNWMLLRLDTEKLIRGTGFHENPYRIVFHEYVHLLLRRNLKSLPLWFDEGVAEFWSNTIIDEDRASVGLPINGHVLMLRSRTLPPLSWLFAVDAASSEYSEGDRATLFYAQSWALVHYLAVGSVDRRGQLNRFAERLAAGKPPEAAAREAFGDLGALDRELEGYVRRTSFLYRKKELPLRVDAKAFAVRPLPEAESLAVRASFYAATRRGGEARARAAEALALDPGTSMAHEALAYVSWEEGDDERARRELALAVALPGATDFAHYLDGVTRMHGAGGTATLDAAEASLRRAIAVNPSFADAYAALAQAMAMRGDPVERTLPLAVKAATLEPGEIRHSLNALRIAARGGRVQDARVRAEELLAAANGEDRRKLQALLLELSTPEPTALAQGCDEGDLPCAAAAAALDATDPAPTCDPAEPPRDERTPLPFLADRLRAPDPATRAAAAQAFAGARPVLRETIEALVKSLADPDSQVRASVRAALDRLSCEPEFATVAAGLDRPPRPLKVSRPQYPREAYGRKVEGTVKVGFLIGRSGDVRRVRVLESVPGLDEAALESVRSWLFVPAVRSGRVVPTAAQAPVAFRIE